MNRIEELKEAIQGVLPAAEVSLERPLHEDGVWWLDVRLGKHAVAIEWKRSRGFGVSSVPAEGLGGGPDELYREAEAVVERVAHLLQTESLTQAPDVVGLRRLRESHHVSQQELAALLGAGQAAISKIERRDDVSITTLRRIVEALGGELEIRARFAGRSIRIDPSAQ